MYKSGDVVLAAVQFADSFQVKKRPAAVLFSELGNAIVAGITSNVEMKGILLGKEDGAIKQSVIKPNYIFTLSEKAIEKKLFTLSTQKRKQLHEALESKIKSLLE